MRPRANWIVVAVCAGVLLLGACQGKRTTSSNGTGGTSIAGAGPATPLRANVLAGRMAMALEDAGDHVLLSDQSTRVRIWKDSDRVSVAGREAVMGGRTERRGRGLIVPASTASYLEKAVASERGRLSSFRRPRTRRPVAVPVVHTPRPVVIPNPVVTPEPAPSLRRPSVAAAPGWEPRATARDWQWIVIHHSDDTKGNLARYDKIHRENNGWDECGYHFVIGNGSLSRDGQVEISTRWPVQKHGAHARNHSIGDNRYNERGIGICLVGDFDRGCARPSACQMENLAHLVRWLMERYGISAKNVVGHAECCPTACPGRNFPWADLRRRLGS